tara:strand:- start:302 stop:763 length:462 start_codon:yes stop_codon:yes gene_type:complete
MRGTYCPEHLHLYHLLCKWEAEEEKEAEMKPSRFRDKVKKGVSIVSVPVSAAANTDPPHPILKKYETFFAEIMADARQTKGIYVNFIANPETGVNDITHIMFDMRMFQKELLEMANPTPAFQDVLRQQAAMHQQHQSVPPLPVVPEMQTEVQQ